MAMNHMQAAQKRKVCERIVQESPERNAENTA